MMAYNPSQQIDTPLLKLLKKQIRADVELHLQKSPSISDPAAQYDYSLLILNKDKDKMIRVIHKDSVFLLECGEQETLFFNENDNLPKIVALHYGAE